MIFCLSCKRLVPEGEYCPWCQRSWGASICDGCGHRNVAGVPACVKCRSLSLSDAALGIPLGWVPPLLSGLALLGILRLILPHLGTILAGGEEALASGVSMLVGSNALTVKNRFWDCCTLAFLVLPGVGCLMGAVLPDRGGIVGATLRSLPLRIGAFAWHTVLFGARAATVWVWGIFFGRKKTVGGTKSPKGGKGTP